MGKFLLRMCACFSENVPKGDFINMKCQWRVILVDILWPSVQARCVSWRRTSLLCLWVCQRAAAPFLPIHSSLCSYHTKDRPFLPKEDTPAVEMMPSVLKSLPQLLSAPGMRSPRVFGSQKSMWNAPFLLVKGYPQCFQRMLCGQLGNPGVQLLY